MLLGGRTERNDARTLAMPFIDRSLAPSKGCLSDRDRNIQLDPAPAYPDAVAARLEIGNLSDVNREHTRLEVPDDSAAPSTIFTAVSCARKSVTLVNFLRFIGQVVRELWRQPGD